MFSDIKLDIDKFEILENQKIGLVVANGAGKTTFIKVLIGETDINAGDICLTDSYSYISQSEDIEENILLNNVSFKVKKNKIKPNKFEQ